MVKEKEQQTRKISIIEGGGVFATIPTRDLSFC